MKKTILSFLLRLSIMTGLFLVVSVGTTFAVANDYVVTGGDIVALPTVGAASSAINTITLADAGGDDFSDVDGTEVFIVTLNQVSYPSVQFDQTVVFGGLTVAGTCGHNAASALTFTDAYTANVTVTGAGGVGTCAAAETITIAGLKVKTVYSATAPAAAKLVSVDNSVTAAGSTVASSTTMSLAVSAAAGNFTVALAAQNTVVGVAGNTTITIVDALPFAMDPADTLVITFPSYIDITGVDAEGATGTLDNGDAATITCQDSSQVLTCTVSGANTATTGTIILTGIRAGAVGTTNITSAVVVNEGVSGNNTTSDSDVALTDTTAGDLTSATATAPTYTAYSYNKHTFTFTTTATIPNLGKIAITFPSGWNVADVAGQQGQNLSGLTGTWTATVSGQTVTLTQTGGALATAGVKVIALDGIQTTGTLGAGGNIAITTKTADSANIETVADVSSGTIVAGNSSGTSDDDEDTAEEENSEEEDAVEGEEDAVEGEEEDAVEGEEDAVEGEEGTVEGEEGTVEGEEGTVEGEEGTVEGEEGTVEGEEGAVEFADVAEDHMAVVEITALAEEGVLNGDPDGDFRPDDPLNRAEAAKVLFKVLGLEEPAVPSENPFVDVEAEEWYAGYVAELKALELVHGNPDGTYRPSSNINRAEFLTLAMNVYYYVKGVEEVAEGENIYADLEENAWYTKVVLQATALNFVHGGVCGEDKCFNAESEITRAEASIMLYNMFYKPPVEPVEEPVVEPVVE